MPKHSIGTDIIEIYRIKEIYERFGNHFVDKFFTSREREYCFCFPALAMQRIAGRFAAKESIAKALGVGFGKNLKWLDLEILPSKEGRPELFLHNQARALFSNLEISLSISHCKNYATAVAIAISTKQSQ